MRLMCTRSRLYSADNVVSRGCTGPTLYYMDKVHWRRCGIPRLYTGDGVVFPVENDSQAQWGKFLECV